MRKQAFILLLFTLVTSQLFAQVTRVYSNPPNIKPNNPVVYDSSINFLGNINVDSYKGQILFGIPRHIGFNKSVLNIGTDWPYDEHDYSNNYFRVDSTYLYYSKNGIKKKFIFELTQQDSSERHIQYIYDATDERYFPFITLSHLNWLKTTFVNKSFIINRERFILQYDIVTGDSIVLTNDSRTYWKVKEISLYDWGVRQEFVCVLCSGKYTTILPVEFFEHERKSTARTIFEKREWEKLVSQYGSSMMQDVLSKKIRVGMPTKILLMSWGNPIQINSASYGDQYVYNGQYVYVKGGKVTSWN